MESRKPLIDDRPLETEDLYRELGELLNQGKEREADSLVSKWNTQSGTIYDET